MVVEIGGTTGRPDGSIYHSRGRWRAATRSGTCGRVLYVLGSLLRPAQTTQGRAFKTMLNGVSAARRTLRNPAPLITPRSRASPACAPTAAPTSRDNEVGTQISVDPTLCMRPTGSGLSSSLSLAIGSAAIHAASGFSARRTCAATPARCRGAHVSRGMKVLISGAGIAGLSLALRLRQRRLFPVVVERYPGLRDGGYMLGLSDPGLDAAERMGVDALRELRHMPRRLVYIGATGQERFSIDGSAIDRLVGDREYNLMRGDIERALYERVRGEVEVRFGASVQSLEEGRDGVVVRLSDGEEIGCDLVVGADGLHSQVRALRFGPEERLVRPLGARVAAFLLDRSGFPDAELGASYWLTEVGRAAAFGAVDEKMAVAFFIWRTEGRPRLDTVDEELRRAFAGAGWRVPAMLDLLPTANDVYLDEVAQVVMPRWADGRIALLGDAGYAVSLFAGKGATLAMAGAVVLADALADGPDGVDAALAAYEARLRPWVETAQRMARRNVHLFAPANRVQLLARETMLRLAARPSLVPLVRRLLNRQGERL